MYVIKYEKETKRVAYCHETFKTFNQCSNKIVVLLCKVIQSVVGEGVIEVGRLPIHPPVTAAP